MTEPGRRAMTERLMEQGSQPCHLPGRLTWHLVYIKHLSTHFVELIGTTPGHWTGSSEHLLLSWRKYTVYGHVSAVLVQEICFPGKSTLVFSLCPQNDSPATLRKTEFHITQGGTDDIMGLNGGFSSHLTKKSFTLRNQSEESKKKPN